MSRRSSRRSAIPSYAETSDKEVENGVGEANGDDVSGEPSPRKQSLKKESSAAANGNIGGGTGFQRKATTRKRKGGDTDTVETENKPAAKTKRKAKDAAEEKVIEQPEKKVVKKRKTKEEENDTMPLAARTAVATLKKKMYIGAHISSAGGNPPFPHHSIPS